MISGRKGPNHAWQIANLPVADAPMKKRRQSDSASFDVNASPVELHSSRKHSYESKHFIINEMISDSADHQINTRIGEVHDFDPVAVKIIGHRVWIPATVDSLLWNIDNAAPVAG